MDFVKILVITLVISAVGFIISFYIAFSYANFLDYDIQPSALPTYNHQMK